MFSIISTMFLGIGIMAMYCVTGLFYKKTEKDDFSYNIPLTLLYLAYLSALIV